MTITKKSASKTANKIFDSFTGVSTKVTYTRVIQGDYDPITGETENTVSSKKVDIIFTSISRDQDNFDQIAPGDIKGLIPSSKLKFTIETGDKIITSKKSYVIKNWELVAADSLYKLHLEETN